MADLHQIPTQIQQEKLLLTDNCLPQFGAGKYTLEVALDVNGHRDLTAAKQEFYINAPRFELSGPDIYSVYPPQESNGGYGNTLPHIVFNRRTLPWERSIDGKNNNTDPRKVAPWLYLMVLSEDELNTAITNGSVPRLQKRSLKEIFVDQKPDCYVPVLSVNSEDPLSLNPWDQLDDEYTVIDLPLDLFKSVMPALDDLPYMAHVRQTQVDGHKESTAIADEGTFSVIMGNRFPASPTHKGETLKNTAFLISLEGLHQLLESPNSVNHKQITLFVLHSWSFEVSSGNTFQEICHDIQVGPYRMQYASDALSSLKNIYDYGYTLMPHQLRNGADNYCWYRGPFNPNFIPAHPHTRIYQHADELLRFDDNLNMFDISYAAAWQLGKLLALKDKNFSQALFQWKVQHRKDLQKAQKIKQLAQSIKSDSLLSTFPDHPEELIKDHLLKQQFDKKLTPIIDRFYVEFTALAKNNKEDDPTLFETFFTHYFAKGHLVESTALQQDIEQVLADENYAPNLKRLIKERFLAKRYPSHKKPALPTNNVIPETVSEWLGKLFLLHGVPNDYLIPHPHYLISSLQSELKHEAIGLFYLDYDWVEALINGALSIVPFDDTPSLLNQIKSGSLLPENLKINKNVLDLLPEESKAKDIPLPKRIDQHITGFLFRSQLVSGWKGIKIYAKDSSDNWMTTPLRLEKLDEDTLLCLFVGKFSKIAIIQPPEGTHLGFELKENTLVKKLRDFKTGAFINKQVKVSFKNSRTLSFQSLAKSMATELQTDQIYSSQLAFQLMENALYYEINLDKEKVSDE